MRSDPTRRCAATSGSSPSSCILAGSSDPPPSPPSRRASLADLGLHRRPGLEVFLEVEVVGPAHVEERLLEPFDLGAAIDQLPGDLERDDADAMLVGVDQV